ncbi:hypothetical membrane protein [Thermoplasma acidophilum]|uniref:Hypothetical membrane protein n=1 Tax=Thermoplasma acidophilum (strain ATCC 25905 / DSM 1728 / JCM 9062 / NBRC 15155 / AMRC-C165) TaxID=273075 RepID=Q9HIR6_THEAC|nr:hypothetical membrane protein [Thermoplasma acidophilum]
MNPISSRYFLTSWRWSPWSSIILPSFTVPPEATFFFSSLAIFSMSSVLGSMPSMIVTNLPYLLLSTIIFTACVSLPNPSQGCSSLGMPVKFLSFIYLFSSLSTVSNLAIWRLMPRTLPGLGEEPPIDIRALSCRRLSLRFFSVSCLSSFDICLICFALSSNLFTSGYVLYAEYIWQLVLWIEDFNRHSKYTHLQLRGGEPSYHSLAARLS